ncbi:MAG: PaaI family thioesterase [Acidimicrobiia bacterium]
MDPSEDSRLVAAAALRDLNHAFVAHDRPDDALRALAEHATREVAEMRKGARRDRLARMQAARAAGDSTGFPGGDSGAGFEDRAVGGAANPTGIDFALRHEGDDVVVQTAFRRAFEGAPNRVHGGMVAALFDDVTGFVIARLDEPAFTGELTVRFEAAVPVETPLVVRCRLASRERRKLHITGEMSADGELVARCRATYITVDGSVFAGAPDPR